MSDFDLYKGNRQAGIVQSNNDNNRPDIVESNQDNKIALYKGNRQAGIVQSDRDSQVNILSTLTPKQLQECKRMHQNALV